MGIVRELSYGRKELADYLHHGNHMCHYTVTYFITLSNNTSTSLDIVVDDYDTVNATVNETGYTQKATTKKTKAKKNSDPDYDSSHDDSQRGATRENTITV